MKGRRGNPGLKGHLVEKSVEGYILALETINRLSIKYRVETFCYLICNAWELLLKAKILVDAGNDRNAIYRGKKKRSRKGSASIPNFIKVKCLSPMARCKMGNVTDPFGPPLDHRDIRSVKNCPSCCCSSVFPLLPP